MPNKERRTFYEENKDLEYLDSLGNNSLEFAQQQAHEKVRPVEVVKSREVPTNNSTEIIFEWKCPSCGQEGNTTDVCLNCGKKVNSRQ